MSNICGLIIIGNSGVGKSFLANLIINKPHFKHDFSARSITHRTESVMHMLGDRYYQIYNIPGLMEGDQQRIDLNKQEINRAFTEQQKNLVIVIYVFGHQNGRIRHEDITTFQTIHHDYPFHSDSLITIINGLPPDRSNKYNEDTRDTLIQLLGMIPGQICFIDQLKSMDSSYQLPVRQQLIDAILNAHLRVHSKVDHRNSPIGDISKLKADLHIISTQIDTARQEHEERIKDMERENQSKKYLLELRRLFFQVKIDLRRLVTLNEHKENLRFIIQHWESQEINNGEDAEEELSKTLSTQLYIEAALDVHRRDIEQICYEIEQMYDGNFSRQYESVREYYILLDDLRFDPSIKNIKHSFIEDLDAFNNCRYGNIE